MRHGEARRWQRSAAIAVVGCLLASACPREDRPGPLPDETIADTATEQTGDTSEPREPIELHCALQPPPELPVGPDTPITPVAPQPNQLRFDCTILLQEPAPVEIGWRKQDGGPVRVLRSDEVKDQHQLTLYLMAPETDYTVIVRNQHDPSLKIETTLTTGPLPLGAWAVLTSEGVPSSPLLGMTSPCAEGAYAVILDPHTREVLWYEDFEGGLLGLVDAVTFTEEQTVLALSGGLLTEVDLAGRELRRWRSGIDVPNRMHHDVFRKDGWTYVLFSESVLLGDLTYVLDGFYIFNELGETIATWRLIDHFLPAGHNGSVFADDYSHANSIWVDDDRKVLLSFRHLSAIAQIDGDPASPTFGEIEWRASHPTSPFGSDFVITSAVPGPADFERQHNVFRLPDGRLTMFDNRSGASALSRLLELSVDPFSGQMTIDAAYELPRHCEYQGGALRTPAGHPLATCAPTREGYEFDPLSGELLWYGQASCINGFGTYIPRFVPIDW